MNLSRLKIFLIILLIIELVALSFFVVSLLDKGYLPSPFFYDKSDSYMDLFNPIYWSCAGGAYEKWRTIYPPLPFLLLKFFYISPKDLICLVPSELRAIGSSSLFAINLIYLTGCIAVFFTKAWRDLNADLIVLTLLVTLLSTPMLFALERGNLILLAPFFLAIILSEKEYTKASALAVLINLKPYFAMLLLAYPLKKDFRGGGIAVLLSGLVFLITGILFDDHFFLFFQNIFNFSQQSSFSGRELIGFPSSISAFAYFLKIPNVFNVISKFLNPEVIKQVSVLIEILKWSSLVYAIITIARKSIFLTENEVIATLLVIISNLGVWVGGYTLLLYFTLIPILSMMRFRWLYLLILAVIAMPLDLIVLSSANIGQQYSYLSDSLVNVNWTLGLGSLLRPIINLLLLYLLSYEFASRKHIKIGS